jgi:hypothetical protein
MLSDDLTIDPRKADGVPRIIRDGFHNVYEGSQPCAVGRKVIEAVIGLDWFGELAPHERMRWQHVRTGSRAAVPASEGSGRVYLRFRTHRRPAPLTRRATLRPEHAQHYRFGSHMFGYFGPPFQEKDRVGFVGFESSYRLLRNGLGVRGSTK